MLDDESQTKLAKAIYEIDSLIDRIRTANAKINAIKGMENIDMKP